MKFGVREICDVVLKAKAAQKIGNKIFYAGEPVMYFDTLKTSSMEGAATTVYAQGGRGNARLMAWEGERTVTFTMEDALISPEGFMILSGAGLIDASEKPIYQHMTETIDGATGVVVELDGEKAAENPNFILIHVTELPHLPVDLTGDYAYVMLVKNGEIISEPFIPVHGELVEGKTVNEDATAAEVIAAFDENTAIVADNGGGYWIKVMGNRPVYHKQGDNENTHEENYSILWDKDEETNDINLFNTARFDSVIVDYYVKRTGNAQQIEITADKFGGNYYLEASTLFRNTAGVDMPAEFIIPNCKIQSNFTFTMAGSGDPSTFTFTMDAFPDYTRFDKSKKVLAAIQIITEGGATQDIYRHSTKHQKDHDSLIW